MKKEFVVAIAGGGSTWTPGLLKALCKRKETFPLKRVVLFDNNPENLLCIHPDVLTSAIEGKIYKGE